MTLQGRLLLTITTILLLIPTAAIPHTKATPQTSPIGAIVVPITDPYYSLIATPTACHYGLANHTSLLIPLLAIHNTSLTPAQDRLLNTTLTQDQTILALGTTLTTTRPTHTILTPPTDAADELALLTHTTAPTVLILPTTNYTLALTATPLATYLNAPILLYTTTNDTAHLHYMLTTLHTQTAITIGPTQITFPDTTTINLPTITAIQTYTLQTIKNLFGSITYLTLTNPNDTIPPTILTTTTNTTIIHLNAIVLTLLGHNLNLKGTPTHIVPITVPDNITSVTITAHTDHHPRLITPILSLSLEDMIYMDHPMQTAAYTKSQACTPGTAILKTLTCHRPGTYLLTVSLFHGLKGGYFSSRGLSIINSDVTITTTIQQLQKPHTPLIPSLSMLAGYLAAAHGGIIIPTDNELTNPAYEQAAYNTSAGPWYNASIIPFNNQLVNQTLVDLNTTLDLMNDQGLLADYLAGPAWLGILGDSNMIPMYYYGPSQSDLDERGLPSDNPYNLNGSLSTGRIIGWDVEDTSTLIARTLFYQQVCGEPTDDWFNTFNFVFGEGFGETGGIFHQVPYSREIRAYGFTTHVYGDLRNSRQYAVVNDVYVGANFDEYMGHGDWYWYAPSLYGFNTFGRAIDVAHARTWVFQRPSVFLTAACLLGRIDGIPPDQNLGLAMLHAGCNAFVGATRETGSEAGLTVMENHLIVNDSSLGEALRLEKRVDQELPTFYVRTLYGDPAFNPYDPLHGFSDQGRPRF